MGKSGKAVKKGKILNPFWLTLAATAGWGATHVPASLDLGSAGAWALFSLTAGLLVRAALALVSPLLGLAETLAGRAMDELRQGGEP